MEEFERGGFKEGEIIREKGVEEHPTRVTGAHGGASTDVRKGPRAGEGGERDSEGGQNGEVTRKEKIA